MTAQIPPRKSWWSRNWKWVLPLGCLTPVLLCAGVVTLFVGVLFGAIRSSDVFKDSLAKAQSNPAVVAALGTPVDAGLLITGKINIDGPSGDADLSIPIHGPNGAGTIYVTATKSQGDWHYSTLAVKLDGKIDRINLLPNH